MGGWSKTSLQDFVRGGWEKVQPLPYWTSPMSPFLRMRGQAMKALNSFAVRARRRLAGQAAGSAQP